MDSNIKDYIIDARTLECSICLDIWLHKDPRVLPCQHTFCHECLIKISHGKLIKCPNCRSKTKLNKDGVDGLPKNLIRASINDQKTDKEICKKHNNIVMRPKLLCITCKAEQLCSKCIDDEHGNDNCKIRTLNQIFEKSQSLRRKQEDSMDEYKKIMESEIADLFNLFAEHANNCEIQLQTELCQLNQNLINFAADKRKIFNSIKETLKSPFFDQDQTNERLERLMAKKAIFDGPPEVLLNSNLRYSDSSEKKQSVYRKSIDKNTERDDNGGNDVLIGMASI